MGYSLEQSPWDLFILLCAVEKLLEYNDKQELAPQLAESYKVDDAAKTISVKMRAGIKFHDGSDCDADAIAWNFEQQVTNKRIGYLDQWVKLEVKDKLNFVITYKGEYNNQLINGWLWSPPIFSKAAFVNAGNGDIEKSKDWARLNVSGTGPFKQGELIRDVSLRMDRFDDYWGGKPYLDHIMYYFIPDPVTASLKMQAGEADLYFGVAIKDQLTLEKSGLTRIVGQPSVTCLLPNIVNPDSKWQNKDLREAVEYALDKEGIADALGFGYYSSAKMIVPKGNWGYDAAWAGRSYNVNKAKELLEKSGYMGATVKVLVLTGTAVDTATAVKRYLDDIGLKCEVDIADPGRYYGALYGTGWDDLIIGGFGTMGNALESFHQNLGDQPLTRMGGWALPPELLQMSKDSRTYPDVAGQKTATDAIFMALSEGAYMIPIYQVESANIANPKFHTTLGAESGFSQFWARYWLEP
jgi:ABC-type transport system substrate-binding protein